MDDRRAYHLRLLALLRSKRAHGENSGTCSDRRRGDGDADPEWNTRRAKHFFCSRCGVYVFHRKRAAPDHFGVNAFCLENFDPGSVAIRATEGANMTVEDPAARAAWPGPRAEP